MPDLMISYSRRDKAFVTELHKGLAEAGYDVWIDWEDIPKSADWWNEIKRGIEQANAFVFVISPDSINSEVCGWEIDHAIGLKKRFVPILYREVTDPETAAKINPAVSSHNWIFAREGDDLAAAQEELRKALETDLDYVRTHTRLLVRAKEWDVADRDPSQLLRGNDLRSAREWLKVSEAMEPPASPLHRQFIRTSYDRWRRNTVRNVVLSLFTLAISVLTVFSIQRSLLAEQQREIALEARDAAEDSKEEARRLSLASGALVELGNDNPELAVLLGLEANRGGSRVETIRALAEAAYSPGTRRLLAPGEGELYAADISPDGVTGLLAGCLNAPFEDAPAASAELTECLTPYLGLWDLNTATELRRYTGHIDLIRHIGFVGDGTRALSMDGYSVFLWDLETGEVVEMIDLGEQGFTVMALDDAREMVALGRFDGSVELRDAATLDLIRTMEDATDQFVQLLAFSPSGGALVAGVLTDTVYVFSTADGSFQGTLDLELEQILALDVSSDGRLLAAGSATGEISLLNLNDPSALSILQGHNGGVTSVAFLQGSNVLMTTGADNRVIRWDATNLREQDIFRGHADIVMGLSTSPDAIHLLTASLDGTGRLIELDGGNQVNTQQLDPAPITRLIPAGNRAMRIDAEGFWIIDNDTGETLLSVPVPGVFDVAFDEDGSRAMIGVCLEDDCTNLNVRSIAYRLRLFDLAAEAWVGEGFAMNGLVGQMQGLTQNFSGTRSMALNADGTRLFLNNDNSPVVLEATTGEPLVELPFGARFFRHPVFFPGGDRVAIVVEDAILMGVDLATGEVVTRITYGNALITALVPSPDGTMLAAALDDSTIRVWDVATGAEVRRFEGHQGAVLNVAWRGDGEQLASVSQDRVVRLWDVPSGLELRSLEGLQAPSFAVTYGPEEQTLVTYSTDGTLRRWRLVEEDDLLKWTYDNRFVDQPTCNERRAYSIIPLCDENGEAPPLLPIIDVPQPEPFEPVNWRTLDGGEPPPPPPNE